MYCYPAPNYCNKRNIFYYVLPAMGSQTLFRGTLVCRENLKVPRQIFQKTIKLLEYPSPSADNPHFQKFLQIKISIFLHFFANISTPADNPNFSVPQIFFIGISKCAM